MKTLIDALMAVLIAVGLFIGIAILSAVFSAIVNFMFGQYAIVVMIGGVFLIYVLIAYRYRRTIRKFKSSIEGECEHE